MYQGCCVYNHQSMWCVLWCYACMCTCTSSHVEQQTSQSNFDTWQDDSYCYGHRSTQANSKNTPGKITTNQLNTWHHSPLTIQDWKTSLSHCMHAMTYQMYQGWCVHNHQSMWGILYCCACVCAPQVTYRNKPVKIDTFWLLVLTLNKTIVVTVAKEILTPQEWIIKFCCCL